MEPKKVLVVDNESAIADSLSNFFSILGFDSVTAKDGQEALNILSNKEIDLIVSDIEMSPGMGGFEFVHHIRNDGLITKVIMMTGNRSETVMEQILERFSKNWINGFIFKPFDLNNLKAIVNSL